MIPGVNVSRMLARTPGVEWILVDCKLLSERVREYEVRDYANV